MRRTIRDIFFTHQAQTTAQPIGLQVKKARGSYIIDKDNKKYLDFVAGVSACTLGHSHPKVIRAVRRQMRKYLHVMVYGEFVQDEPVQLVKLLADHLPEQLSCTYLTNSGTEGIEGALKLAKRATGRQRIISANNAYHGNTQGAMSVMGYEERKRAYRPLIPGTSYIQFNDVGDLEQINEQTAAVILETIQGGAGFIVPTNDYMKAVRERCDKVGALLILDEIQPGMGRTGKLFAFEHYDMIPDIFVTGKGLGGGFPVGAFCASKELMNLLQDKPILGHITTFGGHPVIAAACHATLKTLLQSNLIAETLEKEQYIREQLQHQGIKEIRGKGLMLALILPTPELAQQLVKIALERGLLLFFLLFEKRAVRVTPPLTISKKELKKGCDIIVNILDEIC
ncbi:MAG: aspartate aminotransferase family protein [Flavobacteriaceae bacterium TMED81]|jgi:acetylornithine/succinyldiaminopimelate/putrescine aminotransferase|nr:MAG: aspartate aminotransferase family protein [Flavobacteriaceae bacterium TMED81]|tara:strand:+ start:2134 stop:3324 length:1191 start_codon:yes stop_codon:yes gene_type:complete